MGASNIKGITIEIDGDTTKLSKSLKEVDGQIKSTQTALRDVDKLLKLDPKNTELLTQKQKLLTDAIGQTKDRLQQLKDAQGQVSQGTDEWDGLQREIIETEQKIKGLEDQYKSFGSVAAQQIKAVGEDMKGIGDKVTGVGKDLTTKVTVPLTAAGGVAVAKFAEVDKTMQLTNKTMGNTEEQAKLLDAAMKSAASNSTFGMSDAANATLNFARAGLDAEQAAAALAPAMNLAAGEGGNLDTVSAGLVGTINGFGDAFDQTSHYADVFAAACNNSALDVDSLSNAMGIAAPVFKTAGKDVEDAALYMGVMANANIDANTSANALKTGLMRLSNPTKQMKEAMSEYNITSSAIWGPDGSMNSALEIQQRLHDSFGKLSEQEQLAAASAIFGKNQGAAWLALINTAPEDVQKLNASIQDCTGVTDEMSEAMMSGFGGSLESLKSGIDVAATSIGEALAPAVSAVAEKIQAAVTWFNGLDESQQQTIATIGLVVAAIGPLLVIIGTVISAIGSIMTLAPALGAVIAALTGPIGLVIAAVAAAVAAGIALYKNWDTVKEKCAEFAARVSEKWNALKDYIVDRINTTKENIVNTWNNIHETVTTTVENLKSSVTEKWETLKKKVTDTVENIKKTAIEKWNNLKQTVTTTVENLKTSVTNAFENIKQAASTKWENIKTTVTNAAENLKKAVSEKIEALKTDMTTKWENIKTTINNAITNAKDTVTTKAREIYETIKTNVDSGIQYLKDLPSKALNWGRDLIDSFLDGIRGAWDAGMDILSDIGDTIVDFIGFSEPEKGPLSNFHTFAPDMMALFSQGIRENLGLVTDAMNDVAGTVAGGMSQMAMVNVTSNTFLNGRMIASEINHELGAML